MSPETERYQDIMECTRPESAYPPMSMEDRAAQFAPFAALSGHSEAIEETAAEVQEQVEAASKTGAANTKGHT